MGFNECCGKRNSHERARKGIREMSKELEALKLLEIEYIDDSHGDGDYKYVSFNLKWKEYEVGYFDGYDTKRKQPLEVSIEEHEAITEQMEELGWI